jgi:mannose-6-phosphate isomerase-like protein (cupin superfamily)
LFVVPKGVEHKPYAENEVKLLLIEPPWSAQHRT